MKGLRNCSGQLFQGRYKAVLVDGESYLLELVRYIHLNPIRARLVREPEEHPWSSHHAYLGQEVVPWLTSDWVLGRFGKRRDDAGPSLRSHAQASRT